MKTIVRLALLAMPFLTADLGGAESPATAADRAEEPLSIGEEFAGPFPSWRDLRRDHGARGDGQADDSAALERALDELVEHRTACVLWVPAGTYRLTRSVGTTRKAHADCQGVSIIGEDPSRTVIRWDGPPGGTMLRWDAWYSKISRLTLDGGGTAGAALVYGPAFSTYDETSDIVFRDARAGLVFGGPETNGQAENEVLRCQFLRCETGIETLNWNSMDIWVWHCRFEDCGRAIHNQMGNWHAWHNVFLRSRISDLSAANLMAFSVVNNTSFRSRRFFDFSTGHTWGSPTSITGNRVIEPTGDWAVLLDNAGPYLVVDNAFVLSGAARAVRMTWGDQTLAGNVYTREGAVEERGRFRRIGERVVGQPGGDFFAHFVPPAPPSPPPRRSRRVFEVPSGSSGEAIQAAILEASKLAGARPVVHLPMGRYRIESTIVVPRGSDLQLVGDGAGETSTRLEWAGPEDGVVLRVEGPSRATLRDLSIHAPSGRALVVSGADQEGGRIFADQLNASGPSSQEGGRTAAVRVTGLDRTDVLFRALQGSGNGGAWVEVVGGPGATTSKSPVIVATGATGSAAGQYDVRGGGRLVVRGVYHERSSGSLTGLHLADSGTLSIDATRFSYATSAEAPTVAADGFRGLFTLATCMLLPVETQETCRFEIRGDGSAASVLALNDQFWVNLPGVTSETVWRNRADPPARGGLVGCNVNTGNREAAPKGFAFLDDSGRVDDETILRHLAPLREARVWSPGEPPAPRAGEERPAATTAAPGDPPAMDLRIHRVMASGGRGATVEIR